MIKKYFLPGLIFAIVLQSTFLNAMHDDEKKKFNLWWEQKGKKQTCEMFFRFNMKNKSLVTKEAFIKYWYSPTFLLYTTTLPSIAVPFQDRSFPARLAAVLRYYFQNSSQIKAVVKEDTVPFLICPCFSLHKASPSMKKYLINSRLFDQGLIGYASSDIHFEIAQVEGLHELGHLILKNKGEISNFIGSAAAYCIEKMTTKKSQSGDKERIFLASMILLEAARQSYLFNDKDMDLPKNTEIYHNSFFDFLERVFSYYKELYADSFVAMTQNKSLFQLFVNHLNYLQITIYNDYVATGKLDSQNKQKLSYAEFCSKLPDKKHPHVEVRSNLVDKIIKYGDVPLIHEHFYLSKPELVENLITLLRKLVPLFCAEKNYGEAFLQKIKAKLLELGKKVENDEVDNKDAKMKPNPFYWAFEGCEKTMLAEFQKGNKTAQELFKLLTPAPLLFAQQK